MKTVLILHGISGNSQENWFPWLKQELELRDYKVICPDLPKTNHPDRQTWIKTVNTLLKDVDHSQLIIVAHSLGTPTALDYIEQSDQTINSLISAAGFFEDYGMELNSYFMAEKKIDIDNIRQKIEHIHILYGDDDPYVPQQTLNNLAQEFEVEPTIFPNGGHLSARAGFTKFPEILNIILNNS
jgi:predicted alpha/beta hydrolase family esterase